MYVSSAGHSAILHPHLSVSLSCQHALEPPQQTNTHLWSPGRSIRHRQDVHDGARRQTHPDKQPGRQDPHLHSQQQVGTGGRRGVSGAVGLTGSVLSVMAQARGGRRLRLSELRQVSRRSLVRVQTGNVFIIEALFSFTFTFVVIDGARV